jgi:hypothetical protein
MDAVVDLRQVAFDVPAKLSVLILFKALELFNQIEFKLNGYPRSKFKGNILVGIGAAVAACLRNDADGVGLRDPLLGSQGEAVESRLLSKAVKFDGIKIRIV